jgi:hypothetical protein
MSEMPQYDKEKGWSCPAGYAWPKCHGCGHNFFGGPPQPLVDGKPADGGLCNWCSEENHD